MTLLRARTRIECAGSPAAQEERNRPTETGEGQKDERSDAVGARLERDEPAGQGGEATDHCEAAAAPRKGGALERKRLVGTRPP